MEVRTTESTAVVSCSGSLVLGERIDALRATLYELLYRYERVVLDLARVHRIDCAGVGVVASVAATADGAGKKLRISGASGLVEQVLTLMQLGKFESYSISRRYAAA
jgi:anti-anti-sigma factor